MSGLLQLTAVDLEEGEKRILHSDPLDLPDQARQDSGGVASMRRLSPGRTEAERL